MSSSHQQSIELINQQHQTLYERFLVTSDPKEKPFLLRRLANLCRVRDFLLENQQADFPRIRSNYPNEKDDAYGHQRIES